jgi:hypothetical protein
LCSDVSIGTMEEGYRSVGAAAGLEVTAKPPPTACGLQDDSLGTP